MGDLSWLPGLARSFARSVSEHLGEDEAKPVDPRDRRTAERHETEVPGRLRLPATEHDCTIIDLSTGGMSVSAPDAKVSVGQQVTVVPQNYPRLPGTVRWIHDGTFGVQFSRPMSAELIEAMGKKKGRVRLPRAPRAKIELPCKVYFDGKRHDVTVGNISVGGVMIVTQEFAAKGRKKPIREGQPLMIEFPDMLPIGGHVRWTSGEKCGVMFSKLLAVSMAEELQRVGGLSQAWLDDVRQSHLAVAD